MNSHTSNDSQHYTITYDSQIPESFMHGMNECMNGFSVEMFRPSAIEDMNKFGEALEGDNFVE